MTDTKLTVDITMAFSDFLPNLTLAAVAYDALCEVGAPVWDEADFALPPTCSIHTARPPARTSTTCWCSASPKRTPTRSWRAPCTPASCL